MPIYISTLLALLPVLGFAGDLPDDASLNNAFGLTTHSHEACDFISSGKKANCVTYDSDDKPRPTVKFSQRVREYAVKKHGELVRRVDCAHKSTFRWPPGITDMPNKPVTTYCLMDLLELSPDMTYEFTRVKYQENTPRNVQSMGAGPRYLAITYFFRPKNGKYESAVTCYLYEKPDAEVTTVADLTGICGADDIKFGTTK
jgi:hypothetical protein